MKMAFLCACCVLLVIACHPQPTADKVTDRTSAPQERIENGLRQAVHTSGKPLSLSSIESRFKDHSSPSVSVAVAYQGELLWANQRYHAANSVKFSG